jgi:hypothetical protein
LSFFFGGAPRPPIFPDIFASENNAYPTHRAQDIATRRQNERRNALWYTLRWIRPRVKSAYVAYTTMGAKSTSSIKTSPVGLTCLYATRYVYVNLSRVSLIATLYTPVGNTIEDLLLLAASTYIDPLVLLP